MSRALRPATTRSVCPSSTGRRRWLWIALALGLACGANASAQVAEPFRTRNLNPFASLSIWPTWQFADPAGAQQLVFVGEAANHYRSSIAGDERLLLDGETWRASVFWQRSLGERWAISLDVPFLRQSGGALDDVVDAFHAAFDLPDGGRNFRPEDALEFYLADDQGTAFELDRSRSGLGDVQVSLGRRFGVPGRRWLAQATASLPTGDVASLTGSGEGGFALGLLHSRTLDWLERPASFYWAAAASRTSDPAFPGFPTRRMVYLGTIGGTWQPWPRIGFKLQLDAHSAFYRARLTELGSTGIQVTVGGWWQGRGPRSVEVAVNEDLRVSTSPDVVLHIALRWDWG